MEPSFYNALLALEAKEPNDYNKRKFIKQYLFKDKKKSAFCYDLLLDTLTPFVKHPHICLRILSAFSEDINNLKPKSQISPTTKARAVTLLESLKEEQHTIKLQLIITFQIENSPEYLQKLIEKWTSRKYYASACSLIIHLNLQSEAYLRSLVPPLIPKHMNLVYKFVGNDRALHLALVKCLGDLNDNETHSKLLRRLLKKFDLSIDECPKLKSLTSTKNVKYLNYLIKCDAISFEAWKEIMELRIEGDLELQEILYNDLVHKRLYYHLYQILPVLRIPGRTNIERSILEVYSNGVPYPPIPRKYEFLELETYIDPAISFIDSKCSFERAIAKLALADLLGFDCEWRPELFEVNPISTLQIATRSEIYIFDMIELNKCLSQAQFSEIVNQVFLNETALKLGYGNETDDQKLFYYFPSKKDCLKNVLDMKKFWDYLVAAIPNLGEKKVDKIYKGLSQLSFEVLGKGLDKREQCSDWEKRPLRQKQMDYAALDAYVLIKIYQECKLKLTALAYDFDEVKSGFDAGKKFKCAPVKPAVQKPPQNGPVKNSSAALRISNVKFLADDGLLFELANNLRILGADTVIMEETNLQANLGEAKDRIILSTGLSYVHISNLLPKEKHYFVNNSDQDILQQLTLLLKHFNISVAEDDLLSRCPACNSASFVTIPAERINHSFIKKEKCEHPVVNFGNIAVDLNSGTFCQSGTYLRSEIFFDNKPLTVSTVRACIACGRLYWEGEDSQRVREKFASLYESSSQTVVPPVSSSCSSNPCTQYGPDESEDELSD